MPVVLLIIWLCIFPFFFETVARADTADIKIIGTYETASDRFEGSITFTLKPVDQDRILLHLPPNWHSKLDRREEFQLFNQNNTYRTVIRSDLKELKNYRSSNRHLANKIKIISVRIDNRRLPYKILDNPKIAPGFNSASSLLGIGLDTNLVSASEVKVEIKFVTEFSKLPRGYRRFLWDFAPRLVNRSKNTWDLNDSLKVRRQYTIGISNLDSKTNDQSEMTMQTAMVSRPFVMIDPWSITNRMVNFSVESFLEDSIPTYIARINRVMRFLIERNWISKTSLPRNIIIWDGPGTVSGKNILLPRKLFRYNRIFYKLFEVSLINGLIRSVIHQNYLLDTKKNPWILPAIEAEIVRDFFKTVYGGDRRLFPWFNWLNPDFIEQYTIINWLKNKETKSLIAADDSADWIYYSHIYHPWHAKGFHLLRTIYTGQKPFDLDIIPKLKLLIQRPSVLQTELTPGAFFQLFADNETAGERGKKWLSKEGTVDYHIEEVTVLEVDDGFGLKIKIENLGTLSPVFEIEISNANGSSKTLLIKEGEGSYTFNLGFEPQQVILDPQEHLLEEDRLNNSWKLPVKVRPLWDFSSPSKWLFAISPLVGGNTFDQNLFGLNFNLSYLERTGISIGAYKREKDNQTLWQGSVFHKGFPFQGSKIYYENSQLEASETRILGLEQAFDHHNPDYLVDFAVWEDDLETVESGNIADERRRWTGFQLSGKIPALEGNFSQLNVHLSAKYGRLVDNEDYTFQQQFIENELVWLLGIIDLRLAINQGYSFGFVPLQNLYPIGGPEGLPGFPREVDLLYYQRQISKFGVTLPPLLTHTNIQLFQLLWLGRIEPTINFRFGSGRQKNAAERDYFQDVELKFAIHGDFINMFEGFATVSIAQPINHPEYKDYRIILFSSWVF